MITDKKAANAMGGKTARACDGCLRKRARWFCAADDAFLCQACDISVHSANQLASRHERARLETASNVSNDGFHHQVAVAHPTWPQGFTRKARTPKQNSKHSMPGQQKDGDTNKVFNLINPIDPLVPAIGSEDSSVDENEDQVICRVSVFDPFTAELSHMVNQDGNLGTCELDDGLHDFLRSDMDLVELAADVESLLEVGLDEDTTCWEDIKGVDLLDTKEEEDENNIDCYNIKTVKVKDEAEVEVEAMIADVDCCFDSGFESLNWSFDYQSPVAGEAEEEDKAVLVVEPKLTTVNGESKAAEMKRNMLLRLNYESVITAWASHGSPWTAGSPPEFYPHEFMGFNAKDCEQMWGGIEGKYRGNNISDREREARVSRYREKRRSRLFSKKIRYEVRKLNAEKRPRMKGRFVKRTSFASTQAFAYNFVNY